MSPLPDSQGLLEHWRVIVRRRLVLATTVIVVVLAAAVFTFTQTPLYRATTTLIVEPDLPELNDTSGAARYYLSREFFETQYAIIRSNAVVSRVCEEMKLADDPFLGADDDPVPVLRDLISVQPVPGSRLVQINVDHPSRDTALELALKVAQVYMDYTLEDRRSTSRSAFTWLSQEIEDLKGKMEESERALISYSGQEDIVSLERRQELLADRLAKLTAQHSELNQQALELEIVLRELERLKRTPEQVDSLPRLLESTQVRNLKDELSSLSLELASVSQRYKPKHPEVISLRSRVTSVKNRLVEEVDKIHTGLEVEHRITRAKAEAAAADLQSLKLESKDVAERAIRYGVLEREAQSNREMFDVLLQRLREADVSGSAGGRNIRVLDQPAAKPRPFRPRPKLNLSLAAMIGLVLGVGLCFLVDQVDNTIKTQEDVEQYLGEDLLGLVPAFKGGVRRLEDAPQGLEQAYAMIRTRLQLHGRDHVLRSLLVTSGVRAEGKSVSAAAIAAAFARSGTRTLLVDADLFQGAAFRLVAPSSVERPPRTGLSDCFLSDTKVSDVIMPSAIPNLDLLPSGLIPPDPAEPLGSPLMKTIIEWLRDHYDMVVLDSPPLTGALDVAFLARIVDGIVVIGRANSTPRALVRRSLQQLRTAKGNVLGMVLNFAQIPADALGSYRYYYPYSPEAREGQEKPVADDRPASNPTQSSARKGA